MNSMRLKLIFLLFSCRGTSVLPVNEPVTINQCIFREFFFECLQKLPPGPNQLVGGNDWDEVIEACTLASRQGSKRFASQVPLECRSEFF